MIEIKEGTGVFLNKDNTQHFPEVTACVNLFIDKTNEVGASFVKNTRNEKNEQEISRNFNKLLSSLIQLQRYHLSLVDKNFKNPESMPFNLRLKGKIEDCQQVLQSLVEDIVRQRAEDYPIEGILRDEEVFEECCDGLTKTVTLLKNYHQAAKALYK